MKPTRPTPPNRGQGPTAPTPNASAPSPARYARARGLELRDAFARFIRERPPQLLLAAVIGTVGGRLWLGAFSAWDLLPVAVLLALHPIAEWLIHVYVLHFRPRTVWGLHVDLPAAKHHRAHHVDPWDLRYVVMPLSAMALGTIVSVVVAWLVFPTPAVALTALCMTSILAFGYEWVHFLTHTSYRPRGRVYKRIYKFHRLHHFKNEAYWMGVSRHLGDYLFKTMKAANEVESSPTARDLMAAHARADAERN